MEQILDFIKPELLAVVPVLYFVGAILKKCEGVPDRFIPAILGVVGLALAVLWVLAACPLADYQEVLMAVFTALTQGILLAGMAVYGNQLFKQAAKRDEAQR